MKKQKSGIAAKVSTFIEPEVVRLGYTLWDLEYVKEGAGYILRVTIDSPNGIYIEDCEKVHRAIDPLLDEHDPIEDSYSLEVSSPGIERELKTEAHLKACMGERVTAKLFCAIEGKKHHEGKLVGYDSEKETIQIECAEGGESSRVLSISLSDLSQLKTVYDYDSEKN